MKLRRLVSRTLLRIAFGTQPPPIDPYKKFAQHVYARTPGKSTTLAAARVIKKHEALAMGYGGGGK